MKEREHIPFSRAFTIVELVIVIAVIGILAAVLIPTFSSIINASKESKALSEVTSTLKVISTEIDLDKDIYFLYYEDEEVQYIFEYKNRELKIKEYETIDQANYFIYIDSVEYVLLDLSNIKDIPENIKACAINEDSIVIPGENTVDLVLFSGQSNMSGRGVAEDAPVLPSGSGYWYKNTNMSMMSQATEGLYDIIEPFGNESSSTGSLVSAFALEYYKQTGCPIVAVSCSTGGTSINQFQQGSRGELMVDYINSAKNYLTSIGKTIRHTFLVWNQGENDAADNMSTEDYEINFMSMWNYVKTSGVERCFIINLGQHKLGTYDVTAIKLAQKNLAENNADIILASDKFTNSTEYMKDGWHYTQLVYNCVGKDTADNIAYYYATGKRPTLSQFDASDAAGGEINIYGSLEEWEYTLDGTKVRLNAYNGEDSNVTVHRYYKLNDSMYESLVEDLHSGVSVPTFQNNTKIVYVEFEDGVTVEHNFGGSLFSGATSLRRVVNLPDVSSTAGIPKMFYNCSSLEEMPTFDHLIYSMAEAFRGCSNLTGHIEIPDGATNSSGAFRSCSNITSVGNIPNTCTNLQNTFRDCTALTSVGKVGGTATSMEGAFYNCSSLKTIGTITNRSLTNINTAFYNCPLEGILRIEAEGISSCIKAFLNVDLSKLIIQVPKGSTTYTTIVTAYPNANIQSLEGETLNGEDIIYTINYDLDGGTCDNLPEEFSKSNIITLPIPTKEGYKFIGWYDENDDSVNSLEYKNYNLKAKWIKADSEYIYIGKYPQTKITENEVISELEIINDTNELGYIEYNGNEYKELNGNYYLVEPIKWKILESNNNTYKIVSDVILDGAVFYENSLNNRTINNNIIYPNNYEYSNIRAWLNGYDGSSYDVDNYTGIGFIDIAFTEVERNLINETLVDNSALSNGVAINEYACNNTLDKIYLLSYQDAYKYFEREEVQAKVTDYALSIGLYVYNGIGCFWLRSPSVNNSNYVSCVYRYAYESNFSSNDSNPGARPVIEIIIK